MLFFQPFNAHSNKCTLERVCEMSSFGGIHVYNEVKRQTERERGGRTDRSSNDGTLPGMTLYVWFHVLMHYSKHMQRI